MLRSRKLAVNITRPTQQGMHIERESSTRTTKFEEKSIITYQRNKQPEVHYMQILN